MIASPHCAKIGNGVSPAVLVRSGAAYEKDKAEFKKIQRRTRIIPVTCRCSPCFPRNQPLPRSRGLSKRKGKFHSNKFDVSDKQSVLFWPAGSLEPFQPQEECLQPIIIPRILL